MESFAKKKIDYALFPCDGFYNMDLEKHGSLRSFCVTIQRTQTWDFHVQPNFRMAQFTLFTTSSMSAMVKWTKKLLSCMATKWRIDDILKAHEK